MSVRGYEVHIPSNLLLHGLHPSTGWNAQVLSAFHDVTLEALPILKFFKIVQFKSTYILAVLRMLLSPTALQGQDGQVFTVHVALQPAPTLDDVFQLLILLEQPGVLQREHLNGVAVLLEQDL